MICGLSCYLANATNWPILLLIKTFNSKSLQESSFSSWEDYFEILELRLLRPKKRHRSASYKCLQNNLQQMSRAIVHSSLDIVFHCVISQIPSWWWCKLFIHRLASLPAHTQPSLLPRPIARLAIPLCIVTILAFSCAALVALRPLFWSTKSPSFLKNLPYVMMMPTFHPLTSQPACPHPA